MSTRRFSRSGSLAVAALIGMPTALLLAQDRARPRIPEGGYLSPVAIVGEVNKPGEYHIIANLSLARVLDAAGGLTPDADGLIVVAHFSENPPLRAPTRAALARLIRSDAAVPKNVSVMRIPLT